MNMTDFESWSFNWCFMHHGSGSTEVLRLEVDYFERKKDS